MLTSGIFIAMNNEILEKNALLAVAMMRFETVQNVFDNIQTLISLRQELEDRITSILSDYTQMINQVSLVSTLTLGMGLGAFGSLLGNTDDQPEWKIVLFTSSCVLTICFSVLSVIESFFLTIHINQVEARFVGGVYPHACRDLKRRSFQISELEDLNSKFNFIVVTFFISFLIFATTVLGTVYIGLGLSNSVFSDDLRLVGGLSAHRFVNDVRWPRNVTEVPLSTFEPTYVSAASTLTFTVIVTYGIIVYRFLSSYINQIHGKQLLRFLLLCSCMDPTKSSHNIKTPMKAAAGRFNDLQLRISVLTQQWFESSAQCIVDILNFQSESGTEKLKVELLSTLTTFRNISNSKSNSKSVPLTLNNKQNFFDNVRNIRNKQLLEHPDKECTGIGVRIWNGLNQEKNFAVAAFDICVLTLSHGCGLATEVIQRATKHWNGTPKQIVTFVIDETTKHVIACIEMRIDVMKQHVIAENTIQAPHLYYKLASCQRFTVFLFMFIYLIFGTIGSIISFCTALLIFVLFNIFTCCGLSWWFLCWCSKGYQRQQRTNRYMLCNGAYKTLRDVLVIENPKTFPTIAMAPLRIIGMCYDKCLESSEVGSSEVGSSEVGSSEEDDDGNFMFNNPSRRNTFSDYSLIKF